MDTVLIINSDDFGLDTPTNAGILAAFNQGLCSSATVMANMPGFDEAVEIAHDNKLQEAVGLHIVLNEGVPLSKKIKKCSRFCDPDGKFHHQPQGQRILKLSTEESEAVFEEISAQIDKCRKRGLTLTHLDSHHQIHHAWGFIDVMLRVSKARHVRYIRPRMFKPAASLARRLPTLIYNFRLRHAGLAGTDYLLDVNNYLQLQGNPYDSLLTQNLEIMIHPVRSDDGNLVDAVDKVPLSEWVPQINTYKTAISYGQLAKL